MTGKESRFMSRIYDPLKQWKLTDGFKSRRRWEDYTKTKEVMFERTHIPEAPLVDCRRHDKKASSQLHQPSALPNSLPRNTTG